MVIIVNCNFVIFEVRELYVEGDSLLRFAVREYLPKVLLDAFDVNYHDLLVHLLILLEVTVLVMSCHGPKLNQFNHI